MDIFFTLVVTLIPLYILIGLGFIAGRFLQVDRTTLANLALFIFLPVVVFGFIIQLDFRPEYTILPFILYAIHALIGLSMLKVGRKIYEGPEANILALTASMGNTGYFGLPLVLLLFPPEAVAIYVFAMLGGSVYEATIGYYIAARGRFDMRSSLKKLAKFPTLYAMALAFILRGAQVEVPEAFFIYWTYFKGAYVVIGMMIIGAALSNVRHLVIGPRFFSLALLGKFVLWPGLVCGFILLDKLFFHMFTPEVYSLMLVMSVVPPAANIVAFAAQLDLVPEKAATTIFLGTVIALFYIPLVLMLTGIQ
ncbi:MAG: AEC family transporter [Alphaproteobacteria bacterium]|nr:AEC family transporter [Alphaproteobacteria bacterium]